MNADSKSNPPVSLPSEPLSAIEAWTLVRDELKLAAEHLEQVQAALTTCSFASRSKPGGRSPIDSP